MRGEEVNGRYLVFILKRELLDCLNFLDKIKPKYDYYKIRVKLYDF